MRHLPGSVYRSDRHGRPRRHRHPVCFGVSRLGCVVVVVVRTSSPTDMDDRPVCAHCRRAIRRAIALPPQIGPKFHRRVRADRDQCGTCGRSCAGDHDAHPALPPRPGAVISKTWAVCRLRDADYRAFSRDDPEATEKKSPLHGTRPHHRERSSRPPNRRTFAGLPRVRPETDRSARTGGSRTRSDSTPWNSCHRNSRVHCRGNKHDGRQGRPHCVLAGTRRASDPRCSGCPPAQSAGVGRAPHVRRSRRAGNGDHIGGLPLIGRCRMPTRTAGSSTSNTSSTASRRRWDCSRSLRCSSLWSCWFGSAHRDRSSSDRTGSDETDESSNASSSAPCGRRSFRR